MYEWYRNIQRIVDEIDDCIKNKNDEALTLNLLAKKFGYSEYHFSRKFRKISGMRFRDYLRFRKLAFKPVPVVLRTIIKPFDCYLLGVGGTGMQKTTEDVKTYFITIPAHKFLHIKNYESIGYWDFWQKQSLIPGQDCETICGLLDSIKGKLGDVGGNAADSSSGQIMAFINEPAGRICSWGIPLAECYGVRLPLDYDGEIPPQMLMVDQKRNILFLSMDRLILKQKTVWSKKKLKKP